MKTISFSFILILLVIVPLCLNGTYAQTTNQTNSTISDFKSLQTQKNANSAPLSYAVFYITENNTCSDSEYKSLKFYQVVTDEYLTQYDISHDLQGSLCVPLKNYQSYFTGLSTFTLPIVISDNVVGQQLVKQGFYGMYEITGTGTQAIYVCSCDTQIESWAGAWILSHELSHFALRYFGEPDTIAVSWVHYIQALENTCQMGNFTKICPQYSSSITSPSGNQIPVMVIYGQGPSLHLPQNAPQSEVSAKQVQGTIPLNNQNFTCTQGQICVIPGDYLTYEIKTPNESQTVRFDFLNVIDSSFDIKTTITQNGQSMQENDKLDLIKSMFIRPDGTTSNFIYIQPTPITSNTGYQNQTMLFDNLQRQAISGGLSNQTRSESFQIDRATGVLLSLAMSHITNVNGSTLVQQTSFNLVSTNMINSSNIESGQILIPAWVKRNAQWWSQGQVGDSEFVQGIQYLIQNKIMQIPQTMQGYGSTTQIPYWIKINAGLWASGQISDDEFVKGIQYLITNGILKIT
ncbi:MAG TPA: hypothetical protein VLT10_00360 [Verrucomicrobiae bacterium]|nr:hypothetical protein [Verrucomicrobiae bacterium]